MANYDLTDAEMQRVAKMERHLMVADQTITNFEMRLGLALEPDVRNDATLRVFLASVHIGEFGSDAGED